MKELKEYVRANFGHDTSEWDDLAFVDLMIQERERLLERNEKILAMYKELKDMTIEFNNKFYLHVYAKNKD